MYNLFKFLALEKLLVTKIAEIRSDLKEILIRTSTIKPASQLIISKEIPYELPLKDEDELKSLDEWLGTRENFAGLVS